MAHVLNDSTKATTAAQKYKGHIIAVPGVDPGYLGRVYNRADSDGVPREAKGRNEKLQARRASHFTYVNALRKLADDVCLIGVRRASAKEQRASVEMLQQTRVFLTWEFEAHMLDFAGVDINMEEWTWEPVPGVTVEKAAEQVKEWLSKTEEERGEITGLITFYRY